MKNTSRSINLHGGVEKLDPNISIPETWMEHSNRNIQESQSNIFLPFSSRNFDFEILTHFFSFLYFSLSLLTSSLIGSKIHTVAKTTTTSILVSGHMMIRPKIDNDLNRNFKIVFSSFRLVPLTSKT